MHIPTKEHLLLSKIQPLHFITHKKSIFQDIRNTNSKKVKILKYNKIKCVKQIKIIISQSLIFEQHQHLILLLHKRYTRRTIVTSSFKANRYDMTTVLFSDRSKGTLAIILKRYKYGTE